MSDIPLIPPAIELTEFAAQTIMSAMESENLDATKSYLRVGVAGGGCSGLQYLLDFTDSPSSKYDQVFEQYGVRVVVDYFSATHLVGTTIDYMDSIHSTGFKFDNPGAVKKCGCGSSFS